MGGGGAGAGGQRAADAVQESLARTLEEAGLTFAESDLLCEGGNVVDDGEGRLVLSTMFLVDNNLEEPDARELLLELRGVSAVAFIEADEQGGLEHSDGVAAFIEPGVLVVNAYPDDPDYAQALRRDLPQFGAPQDAPSIELLSKLTKKEIVPVPSGGICSMGGGVRCLSWQLRGASATRLIESWESESGR